MGRTLIVALALVVQPLLVLVCDYLICCGDRSCAPACATFGPCGGDGVSCCGETSCGDDAAEPCISGPGSCCDGSPAGFGVLDPACSQGCGVWGSCIICGDRCCALCGVLGLIFDQRAPRPRAEPPAQPPAAPAALPGLAPAAWVPQAQHVLLSRSTPPRATGATDRLARLCVWTI